MRPGAHHIKLISREMAQPSFCHLASAGITGIEKEHFLFHRTASGRNHCFVLLHTAHTESITGTSTKTPTTVDGFMDRLSDQIAQTTHAFDGGVGLF